MIDVNSENKALNTTVNCPYCKGHMFYSFTLQSYICSRCGRQVPDAFVWTTNTVTNEKERKQNDK